MKFIALLTTFALFSTAEASICSTAGLPSGMKAGDTFTLHTVSNKLSALAEGQIRIIDQCKFEIVNATFTKLVAGNTFVYGLIPNSQYGHYKISNDPVPANASGTIGPFSLITSDVGAGVGVGVAFGDIRGFRVTVTSPDITPVSEVEFGSASGTNTTTGGNTNSTTTANSKTSSAGMVSATISAAVAVLGAALLL